MRNVVEIVKRRFRGLHQISDLTHVAVCDSDDEMHAAASDDGRDDGPVRRVRSTLEVTSTSRTPAARMASRCLILSSWNFLWLLV